MAKFYEELTPKLLEFIAAQKMFFIATASAAGRINLSPKGMDLFRCIDAKTFAYLDLTGSGNETSAHIEADGRVTVMFCAFQDAPTILRLYGRGEVIRPAHPAWAQWQAHFPATAGQRQVIVLHMESAQTSCGFSIPLYAFQEHRTQLVEWAAHRGEEGLESYRREKNVTSIDGLPRGYPGGAA
ncbi:MAG: pyridoxamine 5'-phosphate oxidase family protein [Candidatus Hydrogenedentes bacterium]|nr:pyridoxamine 5'-phosphate oxidase family protein [Candidatus Hydrogenedentota bacterium]